MPVIFSELGGPMSESFHKQLIEQRRHLHQYPEVGWTEFETTWYIVQKLQSWGYDVHIGREVIDEKSIRGRNIELVNEARARAAAHGVPETFLKKTEGLTGCVGEISFEKEGPVLVFRFDIDALPVQETDSESHTPNREGFRSKREGIMHACGHDCHASIGLTVARWIAEHKEELCGKIKIIFQPAEEGSRGARTVAASGIIDDADFFFASHIGMQAKYGEVIIDPYGFLCGSKFDVTFIGRSAHLGADPHKGRNAMAAACSATLQLLGIARHGDGMTRVNVGTFHAGRARNAIPDRATIEVDIRGETMAINDYMSQEAQNIFAGCAKSYSVGLEVIDQGTVCDLQNDQKSVDVLRRCAQKIPAIKTIFEKSDFGGSEDAAILAHHVQSKGGLAAFFVVGADHLAGHHQPEFDVNEEALDVGFEMYVNIVKEICSMSLT